MLGKNFILEQWLVRIGISLQHFPFSCGVKVENYDTTNVHFTHIIWLDLTMSVQWYRYILPYIRQGSRTWTQTRLIPKFWFILLPTMPPGCGLVVTCCSVRLLCTGIPLENSEGPLWKTNSVSWAWVWEHHPGRTKPNNEQNKCSLPAHN